MEPATNRGLSGVERSSVAWRANRAATWLMRRASWARSYSASTTEVAPKVLVSTISAPGHQVIPVDVHYHVGTGQDQVFIAALVFLAAKVIRPQVSGLNLGAHCPIDNQNSLLQRLFQGNYSFRIMHRFTMVYLLGIDLSLLNTT